MNEADVCSFSEDGQHHYFGRPWRMPVGWAVEAQQRDDPNLPRPLRYWEIDECRRCGYQKSTAHGFTPRGAASRSGSGGAAQSK
jgi:hypothetical protein